MKRLFDHNPDTGETQYLDVDGDKVTLETVQDVEPILERNKRLANDTDRARTGVKESWLHAASIPNAVIMQWRQEGIDVFNPEHWQAVRRKLNDPEWRYLRTGGGRV